MTVDRKATSERLKIVRHDLGHTQKRMAEAVGATLGSWQDYEAGKRNPGSSIISALVRLGVNANWILDGAGEPFLQASLPARSSDTGNTVADQIRKIETDVSDLKRSMGIES